MSDTDAIPQPAADEGPAAGTAPVGAGRSPGRATTQASPSAGATSTGADTSGATSPSAGATPTGADSSGADSSGATSTGAGPTGATSAGATPPVAPEPRPEASRGHRALRPPATGVRRVVPLTLGWVELPRSCSVLGAPADQRLREPVPGVLVEVDGGWVLLDTGYNPALIRDPALYRRFHGRFPGVVPLLPAGDDDPLLDALDRAGVPVPAIDAVAVSHLHNDHTGGIRHFAGRAPVHLQREELAWAVGHPEEAEANGMARVDFDDPGVDWRLAEGDVEIAPGVEALATPGHTPGHQSFLVRYDESVGGGGFVFAFDAADLTENIVHESPIGETIGVDPAASVAQIRRLKAVAAAEHLRLVPGHDPDVWPRLTRDLAAAGGMPQIV